MKLMLGLTVFLILFFYRRLVLTGTSSASLNAMMLPLQKKPMTTQART